jgi:hypothetical protein
MTVLAERKLTQIGPTTAALSDALDAVHDLELSDR